MVSFRVNSLTLYTAILLAQRRLGIVQENSFSLFFWAARIHGTNLLTTQSDIDLVKLSSKEIRGTWVSLEHIIAEAISLVTPTGDGIMLRINTFPSSHLFPPTLRPNTILPH